MAPTPSQFKRGSRRGRDSFAITVTRLALVVVTLMASMSRAQSSGQSQLLVDPPYDVAPRPTDPGRTATFDPDLHHLVELVSIETGRWTPTNPQVDLFDGSFTPGGVFFRMDVTVAGLINPPGPNDFSSFDPFRYGQHPVYGFIEVDMDDDNQSGGEVEAPEFRFLANVARFGGLLAGAAFHDRQASSDSDLDGNFVSKPYVERHGEEFHLAFLGGLFGDGDVTEIVGNGDLNFDVDEEWIIDGSWFHRAHGFEPFSIAAGGSVPGEYAPESTIRFAHDCTSDLTLISLVFPLTNGAWAMQHGMAAEPMNHDPSDQSSINEALRDLVISAEVVEIFPTGMPEEVLILPWDDKSHGQFLDATQWRITALLGSAYTDLGGYFVWTDVYPNPVRGDINGENGASEDDRDEIENEIDDHDGDDGVFDDRVVLDDFAAEFSVLDLNQDGVIDPTDILLVSKVGDEDDDGDIDLRDFARFQQCFGESGALGGCERLDLNADQTVDNGDAGWFVNVMTGPTGF